MSICAGLTLENCLIISPYSRGGLVASEVFDHTSQLRFLERRFGVQVPNLSAWRRATTGDMTSAFDFARRADDQRPSFRKTSVNRFTSDEKPMQDAGSAVLKAAWKHRRSEALDQ